VADWSSNKGFPEKVAKRTKIAFKKSVYNSSMSIKESITLYKDDFQSIIYKNQKKGKFYIKKLFVSWNWIPLFWFKKCHLTLICS
jgi:hypothetical protein